MKKTFDFDFGNGEFVMKDGNPVILSGINALKLWIMYAYTALQILHIQRQTIRCKY